MGNIIRGVMLSTGVVLGGYAAHDAIEYEKKAAAECAAELGEQASIVEILPIECVPYGFDITDQVDQGVLVHRVHHLPPKDDFLSMQSEELNPALKYVALSLGGLTIAAILSLLLSDD